MLPSTASRPLPGSYFSDHLSTADHPQANNSASSKAIIAGELSAKTEGIGASTSMMVMPGPQQPATGQQLQQIHNSRTQLSSQHSSFTSTLHSKAIAAQAQPHKQSQHHMVRQQMPLQMSSVSTLQEQQEEGGEVAEEDGSEVLTFFSEVTRSLMGRIGVYKINFNQNLRRFLEIASDQARKEPRLAKLAHQFLLQMHLPSVVWSQTTVTASHLLKKSISQESPSNVLSREETIQVTSPSPDRTHDSDFVNHQSAQKPRPPPSRATMSQGGSLATYLLNSQALPLQINFNPLIITFCLFLRTLGELAASGQSGEDLPQSKSSSSSVDSVIRLCVGARSRLLSKLLQIQIKSVNHALQSLKMDSVPPEGHPAKVIEFIKKWVAKEKVLIQHCIKALALQETISQETATETDRQEYGSIQAPQGSDPKHQPQNRQSNQKKLISRKNKLQLTSKPQAGASPTIHQSHMEHESETWVLNKSKDIGISDMSFEQSHSTNQLQPHERSFDQRNNYIGRPQVDETGSHDLITGKGVVVVVPHPNLTKFSKQKKREKMIQAGGAGMTQDNFYKVPRNNAQAYQDSPWKNADKYSSQQHLLAGTSSSSIKQQPSRGSLRQEQKNSQHSSSIRNLQQKVNSHHRETQHRNLFVEYTNQANGGYIVVEGGDQQPGATQLSSASQKTLVSVKMQGKKGTATGATAQSSMGPVEAQSSSGFLKSLGRSNGFQSDVYGDWKQQNAVQKQGSALSTTSHYQNQASLQQSTKELWSEISHRTSINRSLSPGQFQANNNGGSGVIGLPRGSAALQEECIKRQNVIGALIDPLETSSQEGGPISSQVMGNFQPGSTSSNNSHLIATVSASVNPPPASKQIAAKKGSKKRGAGGEALSQKRVNLGVMGAAQTVTSGFFHAGSAQQHQQTSQQNLRAASTNQSDLMGYQNLANFQWPRNANNRSELLLSSAQETSGQGGSVVRPQTRDSYFDMPILQNQQGPTQNQPQPQG